MIIELDTLKTVRSMRSVSYVDFLTHIKYGISL